MSHITTLDCRDGIPESVWSLLRAGDAVELTARVLTLRDASAARLVSALERDEPPPESLVGQILYAVGPSPAKPGQVIGSAGPTTMSAWRGISLRCFVLVCGA